MDSGETTVNPRSRALLNEAKQSIAGGANSTMRVLPCHLPTMIRRADGAYIVDEDNQRLIDLNMGYGPQLFGHRNKIVTDAVLEELEKRGTVIGFPHALSHRAALLIKESFPSIDLLRFTSTGTEAVQTAVRLARKYTSKKYIVLFEGHYHGSSDSVFHKYHADVNDLEQNGHCRPIPGSGGMGRAPMDAFIAPWNDIGVLEQLVNKHSGKIAAFLMEPVMGNSGVVAPKKDFLLQVRQLTKEHGIVLIFDEIITGFRIARGGAQQRYGIDADLTALSKAMSCGFPAACIGGKKDLMDLLSNRQVFHGGVFSGNPLAMAVTLAVQKHIKYNHRHIYDQLEQNAKKLVSGLELIFEKKRIPIVIQHVGSMISLRFIKRRDAIIENYRDVVSYADPERFIIFQHRLQRYGVYVHPNHFEPCFLSLSHTSDILDEILDRVEIVLRKGI